MKLKDEQPGEAALAVMARFPNPGSTKTRLAADLGHEKATLFYRLCAESVFYEMTKLAQEVRKYVFIADGRHGANAERWIGSDFEIVAQKGADLGYRLNNAFEHMFLLGMQRAVIIASDVPDISAGIILDSLFKLRNTDLVLGPSQDGGYYLIGLNEMHSDLFSDIDWGSAIVFEETMAKASALHLRSRLLPMLKDIDTIDDLRDWVPGPGVSPELIALIRSIHSK